MILDVIKTIILGIIEGITEWLPISSTGHMILANEFLKLNVSAEFWEMFEVVIQLGAIFAVVVICFKDLFPWGFNKDKTDTKETFNLWGKIVVSSIPAAVVIKTPIYYDSEENKNNIRPIKIGSIVVFRDTAGLRFDLIKDSRLLRQYDILGIVDNDNN